MTMENEVKFVLNCSDDCINDIKSLMSEYKNSFEYKITQYYKDEIRVRRLKKIKENGLHIGNTENEYIFTYKLKIDNQRRIEIEKEISSYEFNKIKNVSKSFIEKYRYKFFNENNIWDIDIYHSNDGDKLIIAECELPQNISYPKYIPESIRKNILFEVSNNDKRFNNKNLSEIKNIKELINDVYNNE